MEKEDKYKCRRNIIEKETNNNEKEVDEDAEREMKNVTGQKLSRNKRTKETEEKQADEKERRRNGQIKSIYNIVSVIKHKISYRKALSVALPKLEQFA